MARHDFILPSRPVLPAPILGDHTLDLTDMWREATDPGAEYGEECNGIFAEDDFGFVTLVGLCIWDGAVRHYDRERAIRFLGWEAVISAERELEDRLALPN